MTDPLVTQNKLIRSNERTEMYVETVTPVAPQRTHADPDAELLERAADELSKYVYNPGAWVCRDAGDSSCEVCMVGAMMLADGLPDGAKPSDEYLDAEPYDMPEDFQERLGRIARRLGYECWDLGESAEAFSDPTVQRELTDGQQANAVRYLREAAARLESEARSAV